MQIRTSLLALPVAFGLAAATVNAATVSLSPLSLEHRAQVATLGATCAAPYAPAKVTAAAFRYPTVARETGTQGVANVGITLLPNGHVARAWTITSTGNALLDRAAMETALDSNYAPERSQCESVGGDYGIEVDFTLDQ